MICLSFDTDHVREQRMVEFLDSVDIPGDATFFCTQRYRALGESTHECCPHPVLESGQDWQSEIARWREVYPGARGWRSHSCILSHQIAIWVASAGYDYVSTHDAFGQEGLVPCRQSWGVWHLPIYYMDNLDFSYRVYGHGDHVPFARALIERAVEGEGLYVFDFHPIHLLLNSTSLDAYMARRDAFLSGAPLGELRCDGYGARAFYDDLVAEMRHARRFSVRMSECVDECAGTEGG